MCFPEQACEAALVIERISRPERGGYKLYNAGHIIEALNLLSEKPRGRPQLAEHLELREASVKTLLRRLEQESLTTRTPKGRVLSLKGRQILESLMDTIKLVDAAQSPFPDEPALIVYLKGYPAPRTLTDVYKIRDYAVAAGCREILVGGVTELGEPSFPGVPRELAPRPLPADRGCPYLIILGRRSCRRRLLQAVVDILYEYCSQRR